MSTWRPDIDVILSDSEEEENEILQKDFIGREAILIVVDANLYTNPMRFMDALHLIKGAFTTGLLVNDKQLMGVMFANTEMCPEPFEPGCLDNISVAANCAVFLPLRQLSKPIVDHYLDFMSTAREDFGPQFGIADNGGCGNFAQMLRLCIDLFDHSTYNIYIKEIVYITDRESPHIRNSREYDIAMQKAKDLEGKNINFHVVPMIDDFDYEQFYKEFMVLTKDNELSSFKATDAEKLRERLSNRKLNQNHAKRTLGHFNLSLGPNLELSAQYFNYFKTRCYPRKVKLLRKDNSVVEQIFKIMARKQDPDTLEVTQEQHVRVSEGWHEINLGDMTLKVTPEQIHRVKNLHAPGMMLLGFKDASSLPSQWYYHACNFMYPNDQRIKGSKRLFRALWERCKQRQKVALCLFMRKRKSIPRYVALVPVCCSEENENSQSFEAPRSLLDMDGFKIFYLPMGKHIRHLDFLDWNAYENTASAEGVELFEKIIKKLRINYIPNVIRDPALELLQAKLLAMAFNIQTEHGGHTEMPDQKEQDERIAHILPEVEEIFGTETEPVKKRAASKSATGETAAKIPKASGDELKNRSYVEQLIKNKALNTCTVVQLRQILEEHFEKKLAKSTKKDALVEAIYEMTD